MNLQNIPAQNSEIVDTNPPIDPNKVKTDEIRKLMQRLIPFSGNLSGSPTHILYERSKLMAMIPSPLITSQGSWRWFVTMAPADLHEHRLFEILMVKIFEI